MEEGRKTENRKQMAFSIHLSSCIRLPILGHQSDIALKKAKGSDTVVLTFRQFRKMAILSNISILAFQIFAPYGWHLPSLSSRTAQTIIHTEYYLIYTIVLYICVLWSPACNCRIIWRQVGGFEG